MFPSRAIYYPFLFLLITLIIYRILFFGMTLTSLRINHLIINPIQTLPNMVETRLSPPITTLSINSLDPLPPSYSTMIQTSISSPRFLTYPLFYKNLIPSAYPTSSAIFHPILYTTIPPFRLTATTYTITQLAHVIFLS